MNILKIIIFNLLLISSLYSQTSSQAQHASSSNLPNKKIDVTNVTGPQLVELGEEVTYSGTTDPANCPISWKGGGVPHTGQGATYKTKWRSTGEKTVNASASTTGTDKDYKVEVVKLILKEGNTELKEDDIVYITSAPAMPDLTAILDGASKDKNVEWKINFTFNRPSRNDSKDFSKTLKGDKVWDIEAEFGNDFYGGRAKLEAKYQGKTFDIVIHVRGKNPTRAVAEAHIGNNPFFAKTIARHESGTLDQANMLQFNEVGSLGTNFLNNIKFTPNRSSDRIGWGVYQITNPAPTINDVWSWKANVASGLAVIAQKRVHAQAYFNRIRLDFPDKYEAPPNHTPAGTTTALSALDAATIQLFNGGAVLYSAQTPNGTLFYRSCWRFNSNAASGSRWTFVANSNNYVKKIIEEHE